MERTRSNGAITLVQRFNSTLELSLHFHMPAPDGVFVAGDGGVNETSIAPTLRCGRSRPHPDVGGEGVRTDFAPC